MYLLYLFFIQEQKLLTQKEKETRMRVEESLKVSLVNLLNSSLFIYMI